MKDLKFNFQSSNYKLFLAIALMFMAACSKSSDSTPTAPSGTVISTPKISIASETVSGSTFKVKVYAEGISDLYGAGFVISYDSSVATPTSNAAITTSWALAQDGTSKMSYTLMNNQPSVGKFTVGMTRLSASGVPVSSKMLLCEIEFNRVAAGSLILTFDTDSSSTGLVDSSGQDISSDMWSNGTITVQ